MVYLPFSAAHDDHLESYAGTLAAKLQIAEQYASGHAQLSDRPKCEHVSDQAHA